jgi:hypothetical protein
MVSIDVSCRSTGATNSRSPAPSAVGITSSRYSSTASAAASAWTTLVLPSTTTSCLRVRSATPATSSPSSSDELLQASRGGADRDTTTFGMRFIALAKSPERFGQRRENAPHVVRPIRSTPVSRIEPKSSPKHYGDELGESLGPEAERPAAGRAFRAVRVLQDPVQRDQLADDDLALVHGGSSGCWSAGAPSHPYLPVRVRWFIGRAQRSNTVSS